MLIHSVGHGARTLDEFLALLRAGAIEVLVDIRTAPYSRKHPRFTGAALADAVRLGSVAYLHLKGLGGWRTAPPSSPHAALKEPGFRGYADHLASSDFAGLRDAPFARRGSQRRVHVRCRKERSPPGASSC